MSDAPDWLNTDSAAAYIGIGPATLRRLVDHGEIVAFQIGRVRRYGPQALVARRAELAAVVVERRRPATAAGAHRSSGIRQSPPASRRSRGA